MLWIALGTVSVYDKMGGCMRQLIVVNAECYRSKGNLIGATSEDIDEKPCVVATKCVGFY